MRFGERTVASKLAAIGMSVFFFVLAAETGVAVEFRYIAVPDDFSRPPAGVLFDQPFMLKLGELGRRLGAAASSWQTMVGPVEQFDAETFLPGNGINPAR